VTDNGACYRSHAFAAALGESRHQRITPYTPRHNGKIERYNRILAEEFLYAGHGPQRVNGLTRSRSEPPLQLSPPPRRPRRTTARIRDTATRQHVLASYI
jgi:transposase InsO family protein